MVDNRQIPGSPFRCKHSYAIRGSRTRSSPSQEAQTVYGPTGHYSASGIWLHNSGVPHTRIVDSFQLLLTFVICGRHALVRYIYGYCGKCRSCSAFWRQSNCLPAGSLRVLWSHGRTKCSPTGISRQFRSANWVALLELDSIAAVVTGAGGVPLSEDKEREITGVYFWSYNLGDTLQCFGLAHVSSFIQMIVIGGMIVCQL